MPKKTIKKIQKNIKKSKSLDNKARINLLNLISSFKTEILKLGKSHQEEAQSITSFVHITTHEAARKKKNPHLFKISLQGLSESVRELEVSHPDLVKVINDISSTLANMGI